jgi:hypothetical protein
MAKASIHLPDTTCVEISGSPEEIARVLSLYGGKTSQATPNAPPKVRRASGKVATVQGAASDAGTTPDLPQIVNVIKSCDEAEAFDARILDKPNQLERVLLPLYVVHSYLRDSYGLTSGEISQITKELGIPISISNTSTMLSGAASRHVVGDKARRKGQAVRYKIGRRGVLHVKEVLASTEQKK